jgi:putative PIN family toxin of toxin-antitoxin system
MARRKDRTPVVLDTNVVVGALLSTNRRSANQCVYRLWLHRRLQLVISEAIEAEYLDLTARLSISPQRAAAFGSRLRRQDTITYVNLGSRFTESRDPDDNLILATAAAGRVKFLITNDHDLLDIPPEQRRKFKFEILTPVAFLRHIDPES